MNKIENQLNKAKSNSQNLELNPKSTRNLIETVINEHGKDISSLSIAVINTSYFNLTLGIGILQPKYLVALCDRTNEVIQTNISNLQITCDVIHAVKNPFLSHYFDFAIVGPVLDKNKMTNFDSIQLAIKTAKIVYCCFAVEHSKVFLDKFPKAKEIGNFLIDLQISSHYKTETKNEKSFNIYKI